MRVPHYGTMAVGLILVAAWVVVAVLQFSYNHGPASIFDLPRASWWQTALTVFLVASVVRYLRR